MTAFLEVPVPPGWRRTPEARIDPPRVAVEPRWEYKAVICEASAPVMPEADLNELGGAHWELVGVVTVGTQVHFYFKRELGL